MEEICPTCGSRTARIHRHTIEKLKHPGARKFRCLGCDFEFLLLADGRHITLKPPRQ